ncbi:alpha/beta hydrolase [Schaalia odontolytica]
MSIIASIPLTSMKTLVVVTILAGVSLLTGAALLTRSAPARSSRRTARWLGRTVIVLVPTLLVASASALVFNRSLGLVKTSGDLGKLLASAVVGPQPSTGGEATIDAQSAATSDLDATFTRTEDGMLTTTWTGPTSGITLPVFVITPRDYSPNDGKTYAVIELLHGYPGEADGTTQGAQVQQALDEAVDAGIIPPTIVVAPSLSVDENAHDCADIEGRPAVYTWAAHEIPEMIRHNFPNTTDNRDAWMIGGFSAGAYCAIWTALRTPETFGAAASLSGYDTQIEGQMTNQGEQYLADNTLSTMLANRTADGMRIYAMAAGDDAVGGAYTALKMAAAVKEPDTVTTDIPPTGGHAGPLWREHIPTMLAWWGSSDRVAHAVGAASTSATAQSSEASTSIVPATTTTPTTHPTAPNSYLVLAATIVSAFVSLLLVWCWAPRWYVQRHEDDAEHSESRSHARHRADRAAALGSLPRPLRSTLAYLARLTSLGAATASAAMLIGVAGNMAGGFYTSWGSVAQSFMDGLR